MSSCVQLFSLAETPQLPPSPRICMGSYMRAQLVKRYTINDISILPPACYPSHIHVALRLRSTTTFVCFFLSSFAHAWFRKMKYTSIMSNVQCPYNLQSILFYSILFYSILFHKFLFCLIQIKCFLISQVEIFFYFVNTE